MSSQPKEQQRILVVGATGMLGEPVARRLAADGHLVRAMGRTLDRVQTQFVNEKNIEAVQGSVEDIESLKRVLKGSTGVHINLSGGTMERVGAQNICRVLADGAAPSVKRVTIISGVSTCEENASLYPGTKAKLDAENAIKACGVEYTIFRCTMFMETLPKWKYLVGEQPTQWHWIAAQDYARMVSKSFTTPAAVNTILFIYGPGPPMTLAEALDKVYLPIITGHESNVPKFPVWWMKIRSWLQGDDHLRFKELPKFHWLAQITELGDPREANDLLGPPRIHVEDWCLAYKQECKQEQGTE